MDARPEAAPSRYRSVFRPGLFAGRVVAVTGGGSGIGRCTAHELSALGATVALIGRRPEKLERVAAEIAAAGGRCSRHALDIRDEPAVQAGIAAIVAAHGRLDGLVNNAGGQYPGPAESLSLKGWEAVVRTNLTGGFLMAREAFNQWMGGHGGAIVNIIADIWGGMPSMAHSGAARAGMLNLTQTLASEWAPSGVRVNAVAPGWIASSGMRPTPTRSRRASRSSGGRYRCSATAPRPRWPPRWCSCCRRPPTSSPAIASASTAACPTRAPTTRRSRCA